MLKVIVTNDGTDIRIRFEGEVEIDDIIVKDFDSAKTLNHELKKIWYKYRHYNPQFLFLEE